MYSQRATSRHLQVIVWVCGFYRVFFHAFAGSGIETERTTVCVGEFCVVILRVLSERNQCTFRSSKGVGIVVIFVCLCVVAFVLAE